MPKILDLQLYDYVCTKDSAHITFRPVLFLFPTVCLVWLSLGRKHGVKAQNQSVK